MARGSSNMDLFATEMFPGFSLLVSAHVSLSLAAMLWLFDALALEPQADLAGSRASWVALPFGALVLGTCQPFALVVVLAVAAIELGLRWARREPGAVRLGVRALMAAAIAAPLVLHEAATIRGNPAFSGWRDQLHTL